MPYADRQRQRQYKREYMRAYMRERRRQPTAHGPAFTEGSNKSMLDPLGTAFVRPLDAFRFFPRALSKAEVRRKRGQAPGQAPGQDLERLTLTMLAALQRRIDTLEQQQEATQQQFRQLVAALALPQRIMEEHAADPPADPCPYTQRPTHHHLTDRG